MTTNCFMTHKIVPVISDDDHKRHHVVKKNSPREVKDPTSPTKYPSSPTKHPPTSPTKHHHSPTKHPHSPTKHPHSPTKQPHPQLASPGSTGEDSPVSPTKIKSPTKHHTPGGGHHRSHPHHHTHQHHRHHHHHHHKHHSKHDGEPEASSSEPSAGQAVPAKSSKENTTILRTLQPTSPPKFLLAYVPKVNYCSSNLSPPRLAPFILKTVN